MGLSGDGPRGAGSPGRSRAGRAPARAPAGGQPGGTSGARRAVEKPWRGGGVGELLGGLGGWDGVKSGFIFPIRAEPQDYVVVPDQPWLDGINAGDGYVRQFVAMPLGLGYTVEGQVTGAEEFGGIQLL